MTSYARVTFKAEDARRSTTCILEIISETDTMLAGMEVDREGMRAYGKGFDERLRVISADLISHRVPMVMDLTYGELVPA